MSSCTIAYLPPLGRGYVVNVASARNGVGYGAWTHIDGWSETVVDYIRSLEADDTTEPD
jgi:60 kDa SS-A/Ro ribonucleoprotein